MDRREREERGDGEAYRSSSSSDTFERFDRIDGDEEEARDAKSRSSSGVGIVSDVMSSFFTWSLMQKSHSKDDRSSSVFRLGILERGILG